MPFRYLLPIVATISFAILAPTAAETIDRQALVTRHNIEITAPIKRSVMQVGNGEFAFGVDVTGLQTTAGNTMSQWGWMDRERYVRRCR